DPRPVLRPRLFGSHRWLYGRRNSAGRNAKSIAQGHSGGEPFYDGHASHRRCRLSASTSWGWKRLIHTPITESSVKNSEAIEWAGMIGGAQVIELPVFVLD